MPNDPGIAFLKGVAYEGMGDRRRAAEHFQRITAGQGEAAKYAQARLKAWGYAK